MEDLGAVIVMSVLILSAAAAFITNRICEYKETKND